VTNRQFTFSLDCVEKGFCDVQVTATGTDVLDAAVNYLCDLHSESKTDNHYKIEDESTVAYYGYSYSVLQIKGDCE